MVYNINFIKKQGSNTTSEGVFDFYFYRAYFYLTMFSIKLAHANRLLSLLNCLR